MPLPERQPRCEWPYSVLLPGSGLGKLLPLVGPRKQSPKISWQTTSTSTSKHLHNNDHLMEHPKHLHNNNHLIKHQLNST